MNARGIVASILLGGALLGLAACNDPLFGSRTTSLAATLGGSNEVPPVATQGTGTAEMTYDSATRTLNWKVGYGRLSGPATAAHFHGPAGPEANAGVVVDIGKGGLASPMTGSAVLTEAQAADLLAGRWYINVHTKNHPGGEIRGQVVAAK